MDQGRACRDHRDIRGTQAGSDCAAQSTQGVINLRDRFPRLRVGYEDPAYIGHEDPWHFVLVCRHGHIAPAGGGKLWASTNRPRSTKMPEVPKKAADKLLQLAAENPLQIQVKQDGDDGLSVQFDVSLFDDVARVMKPLGV